MGGGLLQGQLRRRAHGRFGRHLDKMQPAHFAGRRLELLSAAAALGLPLRHRTGRAHGERRLPGCQGAVRSCNQQPTGEATRGRQGDGASGTESSKLSRVKGRSMKAMPALGCCFGILAAVGCALFAPTGNIDAANAKSGRDAKRAAGQASGPGAPMLAIVSLGDQRVSIYDGNGRRILQSPVSTGQTGLETPSGIYSIVQKKEIHQSNVYEDGNMPFMQRITWTGIALHAGVLPGYAASHGCVRMPHAFAQHLYGLTDIGMRVIILRDDVAPADIEHPALFKPDPRRTELALAAPPVSDRPPPVRLGASSTGVALVAGSARQLEILRSIAEA